MSQKINVQSRVLIATFSPWENGKRLSTNGNIEPLLDFFTPRVKETVLIDQPYPGSDRLAPIVEIHTKSKMQKRFTLNWIYVLLAPFLKAVNYDETHISFKIRDFLSVLDTGFRHKNQFDYFIGMEAINTLAGIVLKKLGKVKIVVYYLFDYSPDRYGKTWFNDLYLWLDRFCVKHADFTWDVSKAYLPARIKVGLDPEDARRVLRVPIGVYEGQLQSVPHEKIIPYSLVFMGTLSMVTGPDIAIRSLPYVIKKFSQATLHIVGGGDGDIARLKKLIKQLEIEEKVIFHGFISDRVKVSEKIKYYQLALAPYPAIPGSPRFYGDANKIHTYLAAGLPVVSTNVPPTGVETAEKGAGVTTTDDPKDFAEGIIKILSDKEQYFSMRENAVKISRENTWDKEFSKAFNKMQKQ